MEPRLLTLYNGELQHLREMGAEFAREFPKVASRLGIDGTEVATRTSSDCSKAPRFSLRGCS